MDLDENQGIWRDDLTFKLILPFLSIEKPTTYKAIQKELASGKPRPLYFFYGGESYFIDELATIAEHKVLKPGEEAFNKTVFYGKDSDATMILDQVSRFPMMAERQLVVLKEGQALSDFDKLKPIFDKPVPSTVLVILYKKEKMDKRLSIFKSINKNAVVFESKSLYENQVPVWLNGYMKERKVKLSPRAIQLLVEYLGTDLEKLSNAVDKLAILGDQTEITDKTVEDTIGISRAYNIFELQEAMGEKNVPKVLRIVELMEQDMKHNPLPMTIPSLFGYISKLYMIKPSGSKIGEVKKAIRIRSDFIVQKYIAAAKKYSYSELESMIHTLKDFDLKSKGVNVRDISQEELFKEMMLRLVNPQAHLIYS